MVHPKPPEKLVQDCMAGKVVLFAGPGVAASAGLPTGRTLLRRILDRVPELSDEDSSQHVEDLRSKIETVEPSFIAELLQLRLGTDKVTRLLGQSLRESAPARQSLFLALGAIPFAGAMTTNWDLELDRAFDRRGPVVIKPSMTSLAAVLREQQFFLLKAYGELAEPASVLFSFEQYRHVITDNPDYRRFVSSVFANGTLLFLGASPAEIRDFLSTIDIRSRPERTHFALVPADEDISLEQDWMARRYNLTLLPYTTCGGGGQNYQLESFVSKLSSMVYWQQRATGTVSSAPTLRPEVLREVAVKNIGPFAEFRLPLDSNWNILLGDNGCGKSSILRAVALALCGDDQRVEHAAMSLLRIGTNVGSIELRAGKSVFHTTLVRDETRVRVSSDAITPVQAGSWLALGFPPLRGVSYTRVNGPSDVPLAGPMVEDLLPLVYTSSVDSRLDNLRQWIVNVSVSHVLNEADDIESSKSTRLRDSFFEIVQGLVPGLPFKFSRVDPQTWETLVETEDGIIPISRLSQGMSSFLTWVGTLLQRLYEVHGKSQHPESEKALVLLDEVDAHLHPRWQAQVVPVLQDRFPNLQVLATTHSPLIVGNLQPSELYCLRREGNHEGVAVENVTQSFRGWRADQILTSPAFDLDSTRDAKTNQLMEEYRSLFAMQEPTRSQLDRLAEISTELERTVPPHQETEEARRAGTLVEEYMHYQLRNLPAEKKERVAAEARLYLARLSSGGSDASR